MSEVLKMSLSENGINLVPLDVDFDKLFSLSYTFDNLKLIMNTLLENQNIMYSKIKDLEANISAEKEDSITRMNLLEKKFRNLTIKREHTARKKIAENNNTSFNLSIQESKKEKDINENKEGENKEEKEEKKEKEDKEEKEEKDENKISKEKESSISFKNKEDNNNILSPMSGSGNKVDIEVQEDDIEDEKSNLFIYNEEIENIKEKLEQLDKKFNTFEKNAKFNPAKLLGEKGNSTDIQLIKLNLKTLEDKLDEMNKEKSDMKKTLDEIQIKMVDFNIYDTLKEANISGGNFDASKILIMNLEEKFMKKTQIIDDKLKKNEDDMFNLKNEFQKVKNEAKVINESLKGFKSAVNEISDQVTKTNDQNSNMVNETNSKINDVYKKVLQKFEDEKKNQKKNYDKLKNYIKNMENKTREQKGTSDIRGELSDSDLRCLAELTKRITDLEKQMKILYHTLDIAKFKEEVAKLENDLMQKIDEKDFFELSNKVNLNTAMMRNLKETVERALDIGNKNSKDLNFLLRKLESINATVIAFKAALEALSGVRNENIFDPTRYLDVATFNDFIKAYHKDIEKIEKNIEDVRRLITQLGEVLKTKATGEDMKAFEGLINNKLDEIKLLSMRKFSDKIETNKNFKYIDAQIKHLTKVIMKKNEKNESWLLAKKPIGGHICASCEAYIGELKGKDDFMIWNKYPQRDKEKNYRIGNGFSHMLNMLNVEMKNQENYNSEEINNVSDTENQKAPLKAGTVFNKTRSKLNMMNTGGFSTFNRSNFLPKISNKNEDIANLTGENGEKVEQGISPMKQLNSNEENNYPTNRVNQNQPQPHIVKIYRKNKYSAPDITRMDEQ